MNHGIVQSMNDQLTEMLYVLQRMQEEGGQNCFVLSEHFL